MESYLMNPASPVFIPKDSGYCGFNLKITPENMLSAHKTMVEEHRWRNREFEDIMSKNFAMLNERTEYMYNQCREQDIKINILRNELLKEKEIRVILEQKMDKMQLMMKQYMDMQMQQHMDEKIQEIEQQMTLEINDTKMNSRRKRFVRKVITP